MTEPKTIKTSLLGKFRPVQICLECKRAGKVHMADTVMAMVGHIIEEHGDE